MSIIGDLRSLLDLPAALAKIPPERLHAAFAYLIVPGIVVMVLAGGFATNSPDNAISLLELNPDTSVAANPAADKGVLLLIEEDFSRVNLPLKGSAVRRSWFSLPTHILERNRGQVTIDERGIEIRGPIVGASNPIAVIITGEVDGDVLLPGKAIEPHNLRLRPREAISLAVWCLLPAMVGFGLVIDRYTMEFR